MSLPIPEGEPDDFDPDTLDYMMANMEGDSINPAASSSGDGGIEDGDSINPAVSSIEDPYGDDGIEDGLEDGWWLEE